MAAEVAQFSYAIAGAAFLLLALALALLWRGHPHGRPLLAASALMLAWSAALAWQERAGGVPAALLEALELARNAGWSLLLLALAGQLARRPGQPWWRGGGAALALAYAVAAALTLLPLCWGAALAFLPAVMLRLAMAMLGMLLVEQLYRSTPAQQRWAIKYACLGIGAMFVYDFYLYSDALLFRALNPELWSARGVVYALSAPLLAVAVARSAASAPQLALSRLALLHSATLLGSACYLLAMGAAAYYLRYVGGSWGAMMQLVFLFGAVLLLAGILFSGRFRAGLKVQINKHFYRYHYDYREEWLALTRALSEPGPDLGSRSIEAVAALVGSPAGALWLRRDNGRCEPAAHWHMPLPADDEAADSPFCRLLGDKRWLLEVAGHAAGAEGAVALPAWLPAVPRAWLVLPLILHGQLSGFVLLLQPPQPVKLNWETIDLLKIAGSQVASYLAQREAATALSMARQFDSFNRLSTFVVHDLKNLVSQLSLLMQNAERHRDNPEFQQDMRETVDFAVQKMKRLLQKLSRGDTPERAVPLALAQVLRQAVALKDAFEPRPTLLIADADAATEVLADPERLARVLGHLIQNAIEATPRGGAVSVRLARADGVARIEVSDTGSGMSADFIRERLFKPFDSTKSAGMGIGAFESKEYIAQLGGRMEVASAPGRGSTFVLRLPLYRSERAAVSQAA
ncbi:XrtA/PEP-CTERM system histidine kinase PrsK [Rugamonas sp. DEMB1]|uniref:XrtA/PEP-CTERM system histidine kinase PrsK n=1 Tax=Rugamonas sp. DEMB1 TaxID=3039386 RepID=UPI00244CA38C|nr:XrtA/PEP-CTERM system histidine kinase PrsK [Rugamonas sp. DEMB1]WGG48203.1 PEP-CTERM system histidine kinase PrsK [Rugamonas sp. DEMB1]